MKSVTWILKQKKTWLLMVLVMLTSACELTTCRVGNTIIYYYDFNTRWDAFPYQVYVAEHASDVPYSVYSAPYGLAYPGTLFAGSTATGIAGYYSKANPGAAGVYLHTDNTIYWLNGMTETQKGSAAVVSGLQSFNIAPNGNYGYATSKSSSSVYRLGLNPLQLQFSYDFGTGSKPLGAAYSPDSNRVYFSDSAKNVEYSFDPSTNSFRTISGLGTNPGRPTMSPDGLSLWVPNMGSNSISVIDTLSETVTITIPNLASPRDIIFNPPGTKAYILGSPPTGPGSVWMIDTTTFKAGSTSAAVGIAPMGLWLSPAATQLYTANSGSGSLGVINISGRTMSALPSIPVGSSPYGGATVPGNY